MPLMDVIKYEGDNTTLVWKHPREDYNTAAQLIVHESQEVIVFEDGIASDPYKAGKHTIASNNLPGIKRFINTFTGGISPNHCEIYFINKAISMNVFWGTSAPLIVQDPVYELPLNIQARGQMAVAIKDSKRMLIKLVGTTNIFTQRTLSDYFSGLLMSRIKGYLSRTMVQKKISFLEIMSFISDIERQVKSELNLAFEEYGMSIKEFYIETVEPMQDENYTRIIKIKTDQSGRDIEHITKSDEMQYEILLEAARNQGTSGNVMGTFMGAGMGVQVGKTIGGMAQNMMLNNNSMNMRTPGNDNSGNKVGKFEPHKILGENEERYCMHCGKPIKLKAAFCEYCGEKIGDTGRNCLNCGSSLSAEARFCSACGTPVGGK